MRKNAWMAVVPLWITVATSSVADGRSRENQLPLPISQVITEKFPGVKVVRFERELEGNVRFYEVSLRKGDERMEVEIAEDGGIGEIESLLDFDGLSKEHQERIREAVGSGRIHRIEKHVRIGRLQNGAFVPLESPVEFYEVKYSMGGQRLESKISLDSEKVYEDQDEKEDGEDGDDEEEKKGED